MSDDRQRGGAGLRRLVDAARVAVAGCEGGAFVAAALDGHVGEPLIVGAGKAVAAMAAGAARALGDRFRCGPLVGKSLESPSLRSPSSATAPSVAGRSPNASRAQIEAFLRFAGHPFPDQRGVAATEALLSFLGARSDDEEVVLLLSGGASSLIGGPAEGLSLEEMRGATRDLLSSGLRIADINQVRRHLGRALGGRLAAATRARLRVLALSDVIGDDPALIGSGPATGDAGTFADALAIARRAGLSRGVCAFLERGVRGELEETLRPGDSRLSRVRHEVLANPATLRERAARAVAAAGCSPVVEPRLVDGEVAELARAYAERARSLSPGEVLIAVGEPTLRLTGSGRGGRAQQLALEMALRLAGTRASFVALGSDGSDGPTDAAGAAVDGETAARAAGLGLDPRRTLVENDAYPLLSSTGSLLFLGPTGTNLLDLHLLASSLPPR